jgi:hypothetical protein
MRAPVTHPAGRTGLLGTMICFGALALAARFVTPDPSNAAQISGGERLATAVDSVRSMVGAHRLSGAARSTESGWPAGISPDWFPNRTLPVHPETGQPFVIEIVDAPASVLEPEERTFDIRAASPRTLWYNRTNGSVCARIVDDGDPMSTVLRFEQANRRTPWQ